MLIEYLVSPNCLAWRPRSVTSMFYYCYHTVVPSSHGSCAARVLLVCCLCTSRVLVCSSPRLLVCTVAATAASTSDSTREFRGVLRNFMEFCDVARHWHSS